MCILVVGFLFRSSMGPAEFLLNMLGEQALCATVLTACALLDIALNFALVPKLFALPLALVASSALFALAHHWVQTDPFLPAVFMTRLMIGAFCALLYWWRGLGVAVGAHIVYDLVVGLKLT